MRVKRGRQKDFDSTLGFPGEGPEDNIVIPAIAINTEDDESNLFLNLFGGSGVPIPNPYQCGDVETANILRKRIKKK